MIDEPRLVYYDVTLGQSCRDSAGVVEVETVSRKPQRKWFGRVKTLFQRVRDVFPLTLVGLLVMAGCALALLHFGLSRLDLVLLVVGAVGLALGAMSLVAVSATALVLWLRLRRGGPVDAGDIRMECGHPVDTGFSVGHPWYVPFIGITWSWQEPEARVEQTKRRRRLHERITPTRRALTDRVVRRFEVSDIFGFCRIAFPAAQERKVHFVPSTGALEQMQVVRCMAGGEDITHPDGPPMGERVDMRSYQSGDPIRFILWKVFARTRQVVVRTPERAIAPVRQTVAYLVAGRDDEPGAGAARVAVEAGCLGGDWVLGADGDSGAVRTADAALAAISRSAMCTEAQWGAGLQRFLAEATPGGHLARALVFVPATPGPWIERVVAAAAVMAGQPGKVELVVCCDGVERKGVASRLDRILRRPGEAAHPAALRPATMTALRQVVQGLARARCAIVVIDRQTGHVFSDARLHAYMRAAA